MSPADLARLEELLLRFLTEETGEMDRPLSLAGWINRVRRKRHGRSRPLTH